MQSAKLYHMYTGQTFMEVLHVVYFLKALGTSTAKMILGVKYKNVQNPICFKFKFLFFCFFSATLCWSHGLSNRRALKGRSQASVNDPFFSLLHTFAVKLLNMRNGLSPVLMSE